MLFLNGELVVVETTVLSAGARVRAFDGHRLHVAFEPGHYLPWLEELVVVRRLRGNDEEAFEARLVHCSSATAVLALHLQETPRDEAADADADTDKPEEIVPGGEDAEGAPEGPSPSPAPAPATDDVSEASASGAKLRADIASVDDAWAALVTDRVARKS